MSVQHSYKILTIQKVIFATFPHSLLNTMSRFRSNFTEETPIRLHWNSWMQLILEENLTQMSSTFLKCLLPAGVSWVTCPCRGPALLLDPQQGAGVSGGDTMQWADHGFLGHYGHREAALGVHQAVSQACDSNISKQTALASIQLTCWTGNAKMHPNSDMFVEINVQSLHEHRLSLIEAGLISFRDLMVLLCMIKYLVISSTNGHKM